MTERESLRAAYCDYLNKTRERYYAGFAGEVLDQRKQSLPREKTMYPMEPKKLEWHYDESRPCWGSGDWDILVSPSGLFVVTSHGTWQITRPTLAEAKDYCQQKEDEAAKAKVKPLTTGDFLLTFNGDWVSDGCKEFIRISSCSKQFYVLPITATITPFHQTFQGAVDEINNRRGA
jgi:hypothetical protein